MQLYRSYSRGSPPFPEGVFARAGLACAGLADSTVASHQIMLDTMHFKPAVPYDRWIFAGLIAVILAVIGVGYGPRVFVPGLFHPAIQHVLIRIHVAFVAIWLCAFAAQGFFAATRRMSLHRRFGIWAFRIAAVWVVTALLALAVLLHQDASRGSEAFLLLTRITIFSGFMIMAWRERIHPPEHKRWIILAMSQAMIGGIKGLPIDTIHGNFSRAALLALFFPLALLVYDWLRDRRLHRATLWGAGLILAVHLVRIPISESTAWLGVAHWIASIGV